MIRIQRKQVQIKKIQDSNNIMQMVSHILTAFISFLILFSCNSKPKDDGALFAMAKKDFANSDFKSAIEKFGTLIIRNYLNDSAYYYRGLSYSQLNDNKNAIADFTHLIRRGSTLKNNALQGRGNIYLNSEEFDKALSDFNAAIEDNPKDHYSFYVRGIIKTERKIPGFNPDTTFTLFEATETGKPFYRDYRGAVDDFSKAIEQSPNEVDAVIRRGKIYENLEKYDLALADYNRAISINGKYFDAFLARAILYKNLKNSSGSLQDFNSAIELDPENPFAYANRGFLKRELLNDKDGACSDIKKARSLGLPMSVEDIKYCN
jgi:tetratricopeptide (TPR) repeat protein